MDFCPSVEQDLLRIRKPLAKFSLINSKTLLLCRVRRIGFIPWEAVVLPRVKPAVRKLAIWQNLVLSMISEGRALGLSSPCSQGLLILMLLYLGTKSLWKPFRESHYYLDTHAHTAAISASFHSIANAHFFPIWFWFSTPDGGKRQKEISDFLTWITWFCSS